MKTPAPVPAIFTVHEPAAGVYSIRIGDLKYYPLVVAVSKLLEDASSLIVVTPADTKVFKMTRNGASAPMPQPAGSDQPMEESDAPLDDETLAAIKAQEAHALPNAEQPEEIVAEVAEAPGPKVIRRKRSEPVAGRSEICRRCNGSREIRSIVNDQPTNVICPICKGTGTAIRYGDRR